MSCKNEGRDWGIVSTSQKTTRNTSDHPPEARREDGIVFSELRKELSLLTPRFGLLASRTVRGYISVVLSYQFVVICYSSSRK